jgi:hypothetical protein
MLYRSNALQVKAPKAKQSLPLRVALYLLSMGPFVKLGNLRFEHDIVQFVARKRVRV